MRVAETDGGGDDKNYVNILVPTPNKRMSYTPGPYSTNATGMSSKKKMIIAAAVLLVVAAAVGGGVYYMKNKKKTLTVMAAARLTFKFTNGSAYNANWDAPVCNDPAMISGAKDLSHMCHGTQNAKLLITLDKEALVGKIRIVNRSGYMARLNGTVMVFKNAAGVQTGTSTVAIATDLNPPDSMYEIALPAAGLLTKTIEFTAKEFVNLNAVAVFELL